MMKMTNRMKNKKAQHEMVGFVLIVVIVAVVGVIFLSFSVGRGGSKVNSAEIGNLLEASMSYTTDCTVSFTPQYKDLQELVKSCYRNEQCLNGQSACESLEDNLKRVIDIGLDVGEDGVNKAYKLDVYYRALQSENRDGILNVSEGDYSNCKSEIGASHQILISSISSGSINLELEVCRS